jgi:hypothetical protein
VRSEIPAALDELVMRLLERELPGRYPSARLLVRDLEAFIPARSDSQRAVASMVNTGPDGDGKAAAALADAAAAGSADRAAGRRPVTRVAPNLAAILASARMRQLAGRIPGSVRRLTGLVPVVAARLLKKTPARLVAPAQPAPPPAVSSSIDAAASTGLAPLPAFLVAFARARAVSATRWLNATTRRPTFTRATAVTIVAFLGGVAWQHLGGDATNAATPPTPAPRLAGVRIETLPPRPLQGQGIALHEAAPLQGQGTALQTPVVLPQPGEGNALRGGRAQQGKGGLLRGGKGKRRR